MQLGISKHLYPSLHDTFHRALLVKQLEVYYDNCSEQLLGSWAELTTPFIRI